MIKWKPGEREQYAKWRAYETFALPDMQKLEECKHKRIPLSSELKHARREHIKDMREKKVAIKWICQLYEISREQVRRILNE